MVPGGEAAQRCRDSSGPRVSSVEVDCTAACSTSSSRREAGAETLQDVGRSSCAEEPVRRCTPSIGEYAGTPQALPDHQEAKVRT